MKTDQSADAHGFARRGICILYATVSVQLPEIPDTGKTYDGMIFVPEATPIEIR